MGRKATEAQMWGNAEKERLSPLSSVLFSKSELLIGAVCTRRPGLGLQAGRVRKPAACRQMVRKAGGVEFLPSQSISQRAGMSPLNKAKSPLDRHLTSREENFLWWSFLSFSSCSVKFEFWETGSVGEERRACPPKVQKVRERSKVPSSPALVSCKCPQRKLFGYITTEREESSFIDSQKERFCFLVSIQGELLSR